MRVMVSCMVLVVGMLAVHGADAANDPRLAERSNLTVESRAARIVIDLGGGGIVEFELSGGSVNPFTWNYPDDGSTTPQSMGHFICCDRLGRSTPTEVANGMTGHGEAPYVMWKIVGAPTRTPGGVTASLTCTLPMAGITIDRTIVLSDVSPLLTVTDTVTNINPLGKLYNIVQHPSVAPPFLDKDCIVDSNADKGFYTGNPVKTVEEPTMYWPHVVHDGNLVDLRRHPTGTFPGVVNFIFPDDVTHGWITLSSPASGMLLGYRWNVADYPWVRVWRHVIDGEPVAVGPEFGTTPLPRPFGELIDKGPIWGRDIICYLDTGAGETRTFTMFLAEIPDGYTGVETITADSEGITVSEREGGVNIHIPR
jgi:hypothetical protein